MNPLEFKQEYAFGKMNVNEWQYTVNRPSFIQDNFILAIYRTRDKLDQVTNFCDREVDYLENEIQEIFDETSGSQW